MFSGTSIIVTNYGHSFLGSPHGSPAFIDKFVSENIAQWSTELPLLSAIAQSQPHAAFAALPMVFGKMGLFVHTTAGISPHY